MPESVFLTSTDVSAEIVTTGASLRSLTVPDRQGRPTNIVLSLPAPEDYAVNPSYIGCSVGRVANRIGHGLLHLGAVHELSRNEGLTTLHGGADGWSHREWNVKSSTPSSVVLELVSPDGDQGFPGEVTVLCEYRLSPGRVDLTYEAITTAPTVVGTTHHAYFNLSGGSETIEGHVLQVSASRYAVPGPDLVLTGEFESVSGTTLDFRSPKTLRECQPANIDHALVLDPVAEPPATRQVAQLFHPGTGIQLSLETDQESLQLYAGGYLDGRKGAPFPPLGGICLEPQSIPHRPGLHAGGLCLLRPRQTYRNTIVWLIQVAQA